MWFNLTAGILKPTMSVTDQLCQGTGTLRECGWDVGRMPRLLGDTWLSLLLLYLYLLYLYQSYPSDSSGGRWSPPSLNFQRS